MEDESEKPVILLDRVAREGLKWDKQYPCEVTIITEGGRIIEIYLKCLNAQGSNRGTTVKNLKGGENGKPN